METKIKITPENIKLQNQLTEILRNTQHDYDLISIKIKEKHLSISDLKCYEGVFDKNIFQQSIINSNKILSLPMYPDLTEEDIKKVCNEIQNFYILDFPF